MALIITFLLGIFFLIGIFVVRFLNNSEIVEHYSIAIAFGAMIGIALLDILPEICEMTKLPQIWIPLVGVVIGFVLLVILDHFIPEHEDSEAEDYSRDNMAHIGLISSVAIILHNVIEGMAVYSFSAQSVRQGLMLMVGIGLHNIPMGMFIYSTIKGESRAKRIFILGISSFSTFIGGIIMRFINPYMTLTADMLLYGIALGMIIFIISMELIPYIKKNKNHVASVIGAVAGLVVVLVSTMIE